MVGEVCNTSSPEVLDIVLTCPMHYCAIIMQLPVGFIFL